MADCLNDFTKEEIVLWIKQNIFFTMQPKKRDLLFIRWDANCKKLQKKEKQELEILRKIDCKKRDELAQRFNESKSVKERLDLLKQINVIDSQLKAHFERSKKLEKEREKNDLLYKQLDKVED